MLKGTGVNGGRVYPPCLGSTQCTPWIARSKYACCRVGKNPLVLGQVVLPLPVHFLYFNLSHMPHHVCLGESHPYIGISFFNLLSSLNSISFCNASCSGINAPCFCVAGSSLFLMLTVRVFFSSAPTTKMKLYCCTWPVLIFFGNVFPLKSMSQYIFAL